MQPHDRALVDALKSWPAIAFSGEVWRVTRTGRDPLCGSTAPRRWSPGDGAPVLYTCLQRDGALAEVGYRLSIESVWPNRMTHELHQIEAATDRSLRFADVSVLVPLGVNAARWTSFDYAATRAIASAAHFLEFDGLIVPSARAPCHNLVLFLENLVQDRTLAVTQTQPVDWAPWRRLAGAAT